MIKERQGRTVYKPLSSEFEVLELRPSYVQKYDVSQAEYIPDRTLTPFVLQPQLTIVDPHGLESGDRTCNMINVVWHVDGQYNGVKWENGKDYVVDSVTHELRILANMDPEYGGSLSFYGEFLDRRRLEVHKFRWKRDITCVTYADNKLNLAMEQSKISLSPFKNRGVFDIPSQLYNGDSPAADSESVYQWTVWDGTAFRAIGVGHPDLWYVDGKDTRTIRVNQAYLQHELLCCTAYLKSAPDIKRTATVLARRWYGQYDDDLVWISGKYIFPDTPNAEAEVVVVRRQGTVSDPLEYFDIEILYSNGNGEWQHVCHGNRGMVPREKFPADATLSHRFGWILREKSALVPILLDGKYLTIGGKVAVGQFPTSTREE